MLVRHTQGEIDLLFRIDRPYIPDPQTGELTESDQWIVALHRVSATCSRDSVIVDRNTNQIRLFDSAEQAYKAGVEFANESGPDE